jgi:ABC-type glycerol-3-phosphate transport system substrate-binding protein
MTSPPVKHHWRYMKRLAFTGLLATAALAAACGRSPAAAAHDGGYLGSGNFVDTTTTTAGRP